MAWCFSNVALSLTLLSNTGCAYSTVGLRSGKVAKDLRRGGINAFNLAGSILAWVGAAASTQCRTS